MLDFTSALYLGLEHASCTLPSWPSLTLGRPAAMERLPGVREVERKLADLTGCEEVVLASSTLHLFCDLFGMLAKLNIEVWIDETTYPIARWASDRARAAGTAVRLFPHHDAATLRRKIGANGAARPVIVADGYSPLRGTHAPIAKYIQCSAVGNGLVLVDDTQSLGIFGFGAGPLSPYGNGGGGSLRRSGTGGGKVVVVSSLAKAFGVPLAMVGGGKQFVREFRRNSATLVHCSPPSQAAVLAAERALQLNSSFGNALRARLWERVARFRERLGGLAKINSFFPVQPLRLPLGTNVRAVYRALLAAGIRTVLHRESIDSQPHISFLLTTRHRFADIDRAAEVLGNLIRKSLGRSDRRHERFV